MMRASAGQIHTMLSRYMAVTPVDFDPDVAIEKVSICPEPHALFFVKSRAAIKAEGTAEGLGLVLSGLESHVPGPKLVMDKPRLAFRLRRCVTAGATARPEYLFAIGEIGRADVLLASWWPTAHLAEAALAHVDATEFLYVIQDFEPGFYPWSTRSALAEATYAMAMRPIVNEPFLEAFLRDRGTGRFADRGIACHTFMPAVDREVFEMRAGRPEGRRRLLFYARPRNPRNLFEIGLRAL